MHTQKKLSFCADTLLNNLVLLSIERDESALAITLIKTLTDFINANEDLVEAVSIYQKKISENEHIISRVNTKSTHIISDTTLLAVIHECIHTGEIRIHRDLYDEGIKFYPLKNSTHQIVNAVGINANYAHENMDNAIQKLLEIYQNFTILINDSMYDTLTGLLNRKTFDHRIQKILSKMQNAPKRSEDTQKQQHYLAIFDIDHFKRINDQFGHLIGDEVLLLFSQLINQSYRETDPLFRFGGEEFVGVFECHSDSDIVMILERLRKKVSNFNFPQVGNVSVSVGYTKISAYDIPSQLVGRADAALYYAKNNGRNRIAGYEKLVDLGELKDSQKSGDIELF